MSSGPRVAGAIRIATVLVGLCCGTWTFEASAQMEQKIEVSVELRAACSVAAENLDFGTLEAPADGSVGGSAETTVTVQCPDSTRYAISLGGGLNPDGVSRNLADAEGNLLPYEIYQSPLGAELWGDDSGNSPIQGSSVPGVGTGAPETYRVYANVFAPAEAPSGSYSDRVTIFVEF